MSKMTVYSTAMCPYCVAAKDFLGSRSIPYEEVRIDLEPGRQREMLERSKRRTVPQIFWGDVHIGGYDDLVALARGGGLDELLTGSGPTSESAPAD